MQNGFRRCLVRACIACTLLTLAGCHDYSWRDEFAGPIDHALYDTRILEHTFTISSVPYDFLVPGELGAILLVSFNPCGVSVTYSLATSVPVGAVTVASVDPSRAIMSFTPDATALGQNVVFTVSAVDTANGYVHPPYSFTLPCDYRVRYHSNGDIVADENTFAERFGVPSYAVKAYGYTGMAVESIGGDPGTFACWNTARDGSGTPYGSDATVAAAAHTELYAQWQTLAEHNALLADILDDGILNLPASFTENDLFAVAALIAASPVSVTLDMSGATGITQIPASLFSGCLPLVAVHVSDAIASIGSQAFAGTGMVLYGTAPFDFICDRTTPPALSPDAFGDPASVPASFKILVPAIPAGTEALYEATSGWSAFAIHIDPH